MKKSKIPKSESQALNINAQFEFPQTGGLMSLLQFGSQTLLSEAIKANIKFSADDIISATLRKSSSLDLSYS
jgi:hypothetical protein